jgi:hypothetical protein
MCNSLRTPYYPVVNQFTVAVYLMFSHRLLFPKDSSSMKKDVGSAVTAGNGELECMSAQVWLIIVTLAKWVPGWGPELVEYQLYFWPCLEPALPCCSQYISYVGCAGSSSNE